MPSAALLVREVRQVAAWPSRTAASASRSAVSRTARRSRKSAAAAISAAASRPGALGLADRLRRGVALGAQLVDLRLQGAPALVEPEHLVEQAVGLAPGERRAHAVGVGTDDADVEHRLSLAGRGDERLEQLRDAVVVRPTG